ncbi:MAG: hypothetical protein U0469_03160 [Candidatus Paceibacterota bacterium]|jgi:hypothetical protein
MKNNFKIILVILFLLIVCLGGSYFYNRFYANKNVPKIGIGESFSLGKDQKILTTDNGNVVLVEFKGIQSIGGGSGIFVYFNNKRIELSHCPNPSLGPAACDYNMKILSDYGYDLKDISVDGDNNNLIAKIEKIN